MKMQSLPSQAAEFAAPSPSAPCGGAVAARLAPPAQPAPPAVQTSAHAAHAAAARPAPPQPGAPAAAPNLDAFIAEGTPKDVAALYATLASRAAVADFGIFDNNIVIVDTETTGLTFDNDDLMQIAAARVERGRVVDWYVTFVNAGIFVPADIMRLTGIHDTDLIGAPTPAEAVTGLVEFVGDATLVAHNAVFDRGQITKHPEGACLKNNLWIDTLDLARIALPRLKSYRLTDLVQAFGTVASSHRADDDVAATAQVLRILLAGVDALPDEVLETIGALAPRADWPTGDVFRYFAERHAATAEKSINWDSCSVAQGTFTLRTLRKQRLRALPPARPKVDAAADTTPIPTFAAPAQITDAFSRDGLVGRTHQDYEARAEQVAMAQAVNRAFDQSMNLAVEAGTGVGKSMAYLVPAMFAARRNNITIGVATKTNALLDQLVFSELPALSAALQATGEPPLAYAALKGLAHYPCLRKIDRLVNRGVRTVENGGEVQTSAAGVASLITFVAQTDYDDADNLHFDTRLISRLEFTCNSSECLKRKCPYFTQGCFGHGARRAAETADIVVTNHALLFADVAADGALLPPIRYWVVDEAHGAEEEARDAFAVELRSEDLLRLADRAAAPDAQTNLFRRVMRRGDARAQAFAERAIAAAEPFAAAVREYVREAKRLKCYCQGQRGNRAKFGEAVWLSEDIRNDATFREVAAAGDRAARLATPVIEAATQTLAVLADADAPVDLQNDVGVFCFDMREFVGAADVVFGATNPCFVYSATMFQRADKFNERLSAQIIDIGDHLNETFYRRTNAVVFTSATLTVAGSFDAFYRSMGLSKNEFSEACSLQLASSFDFDRNMTIYIPKDMPEYNNRDASSYLHHLERLLVGVHLASGGGLLTLFANRADMDTCFDAVRPALDDAGLVLERQRQGASFKALRDLFVNDRNASLFALKSFWAGFDAPGDTLRGVIIPKLPFIPPTDPLSRVREERDANAWMHYSLTSAVIDTRQAVGRLIRKADDRGIIILADSRVLTKGYGRIVLDSMPSHTIRRMTISEIIEDVQHFFA